MVMFGMQSLRTLFIVFTICATVKITIGSTMVGSTHLISPGENVKAFPCLSSILLNRSPSAASRKPPPPIFSSHNVLSVNRCPMSAGSRKLGSVATLFIRSQLPSSKGAMTGFTFRSIVLYLVSTRAV